MIQRRRFAPPVIAVPDPDDPEIVSIKGKQHRIVQINGANYYEGMAVMCPSDHIPMKLRPSKYGLFYGCPMYPACYHTIGAHPDGRALGIPGDFKTRDARTRVHAAFDPIWKSNHMKRWDAYIWMKKALGINGEAHIGEFDYAMCERLLQVIRTYRSTLPERAQEAMDRLEQLDMQNRLRSSTDRVPLSEGGDGGSSPSEDAMPASSSSQDTAPVMRERRCDSDSGLHFPVPRVVEIEERPPSSTERATGFYPVDEGSSPSGGTIKHKLIDFVRPIPS